MLVYTSFVFIHLLNLVSNIEYMNMETTEKKDFNIGVRIVE